MMDARWEAAALVARSTTSFFHTEQQRKHKSAGLSRVPSNIITATSPTRNKRCLFPQVKFTNVPHGDFFFFTKLRKKWTMRSFPVTREIVVGRWQKTQNSDMDDTLGMRPGHSSSGVACQKHEALTMQWMKGWEGGGEGDWSAAQRKHSAIFKAAHMKKKRKKKKNIK